MTNIIKLLNQSPYEFYFLVVDKFLDIKIPKLKLFQSVYSPDLQIKNSGQLLSLPETISLIQNQSKKNKKIPAIIPFKPSAKIEFICKKYHWHLIGNPTNLSRALEDKVKFFQLCQKENISTVPAAIDHLTKINFLKYQQIFGQDLVIQSHFGWAGNSTFLVTNFNQIKPELLNTIVKYAPFLSGYSLLNNCCLTKYGLIQSPPALQYTGLNPFTQNPFATVGRQWPSYAPKNILNQVNSITKSFSVLLSKLQYKGWFGLDFIVHRDTVYLSECNPRLTASFAFYTKIEERNHILPLFYLHLAELLNLSYKLNYKNEISRFENSKISGSELVLRDKNNYQIKKINRFFPFSKQTNPIIISKTVCNQLINEK